MTVDFDRTLRVGETIIAALVARSIHVGRCGAIVLCAEKRPVALLIRRHGATLAFEPGGAPIALHEFELRHPGRLTEFQRIADAGDDQTGSAGNPSISRIS